MCSRPMREVLCPAASSERRTAAVLGDLDQHQVRRFGCPFRAKLLEARAGKAGFVDHRMRQAGRAEFAGFVDRADKIDHQAHRAHRIANGLAGLAARGDHQHVAAGHLLGILRAACALVLVQAGQREQRFGGNAGKLQRQTRFAGAVGALQQQAAGLGNAAQQLPRHGVELVGNLGRGAPGACGRARQHIGQHMGEVARQAGAFGPGLHVEAQRDVRAGVLEAPVQHRLQRCAEHGGVDGRLGRGQRCAQLDAARLGLATALGQHVLHRLGQVQPFRRRLHTARCIAADLLGHHAGAPGAIHRLANGAQAGAVDLASGGEGVDALDGLVQRRRGFTADLRCQLTPLLAGGRVDGHCSRRSGGLRGVRELGKIHPNTPAVAAAAAFGALGCSDGGCEFACCRHRGVGHRGRRSRDSGGSMPASGPRGN